MRKSILASALTRAGKSVLHCDASDQYGEMDGVWTFGTIEEMMKEEKEEENEFTVPNSDSDSSKSLMPLSPKAGMTSLQFHSQQTTKYLGVTQGVQVESPYGRATVKKIQIQQQEQHFGLQLELQNWKLANGTSPMVYLTIPTTMVTSGDNADTPEDHTPDPVALEQYLDTYHQIVSVHSKQAQLLLKQQRFFALDATPACILASGQAVNGMLASNVADYLEFKAIEGLYWLEEQKVTSTKAKATEASSSPPACELSRVPCSKNDVFGTRLLQPMDKRRLMKFIQVAMDYATKVAVAEELQQDQVANNEDSNDSPSSSAIKPNQPESEVQSLNERHLNQGRSLARPQNKAVATNELQVLEECIEQTNTTFDEFLSQQYKLSPKLRSIVRYALAWETQEASTSLAQGMASLRQHLQALGRYGTTAFLVPMYGSGELAQAFCRSAAVFGATYLLRRAPLAVQYDCNGVVSGVLLSSDKSGGGDPQQSTAASSSTQGNNNTASKIIKCKRVVTPTTSLRHKNNQSAGGGNNQQRRRIVRRLAVLYGRVIPSDSGEQRHIVFIPPNVVGNTHAIHAVLLDFSARAAPNGCTLLHLTTEVNDAQSDDSDDTADESENVAVVLQLAQEAILSSKRQGSDNDRADFGASELYHVSFSHVCPGSLENENVPITSGLHLCSHMGQSLMADTAFQEAQRLFSTICPRMDFLGLASSFDEAIRERADEKKYDDDEKMMLESALGMIDNPAKSSDQATSNPIASAATTPDSTP
ncbi:MAG: hypothetical protein SGILL_005851 [Bacillariaceae sp.]